jgi:hypothetical protein
MTPERKATAVVAGALTGIALLYFGVHLLDRAFGPDAGLKAIGAVVAVAVWIGAWITLRAMFASRDKSRWRNQ